MDFLSTTAKQRQDQINSGKTTSRELCQKCLEQIDHHNKVGMHLNAVISIASSEIVRRQALILDEERKAGHLRSPLHGIPIIIKDTFPMHASLFLPTTGGAYAFRKTYGTQNCLLVDRLLSAGLIIIATANLTEFCGIKASLPVGWSALGKQTQSPYVHDGVSDDEAPCGNSMIAGSSSGSAASVAAGFAPLSIGQETTGSLVIPANRGGLYSLKVSACRAPKQGALCLSEQHDSLGGMAKSAVDLRDLTKVILNLPHETSEIASRESSRVGFVNPGVWQFPDWMCPLSDALREELARRHSELAIKLEAHGVLVERSVELSDVDMVFEGKSIIRTVAFAQFRRDFERFAAGLDTDIRTLQDLIDYNEQNAELALPPPYTDQKYLIDAQQNSANPEHIQKVYEYGRETARGLLDQAMKKHNVDILLGPGDNGLYDLAACAGYPIGTMPLGEIEYGQGKFRPEGVCVVAQEGAEELMLDFMMKYEMIVPGRPLPRPLLP